MSPRTVRLRRPRCTPACPRRAARSGSIRNGCATGPGRLYESGDRCAKRSLETDCWTALSNKPNLMEAAAAGDPRARLALAHFMLTGRAPAPSREEPARLVAAACAQNFAEAMVYHATLAALGVGRAQSLDDAFAYVARAAE